VTKPRGCSQHSHPLGEVLSCLGLSLPFCTTGSLSWIPRVLSALTPPGWPRCLCYTCKRAVLRCWWTFQRQSLSDTLSQLSQVFPGGFQGETVDSATSSSAILPFLLRSRSNTQARTSGSCLPGWSWVHVATRLPSLTWPLTGVQG
jgi:hypothetical protein